MRRALAALPVLLLAAVGCSTGEDAVGDGQYTFTAPGGKTEIFYPEAERQRVPELSGESLTEPGRTVSVRDFAGKPVVLNIWGSWCPPCRVEAPELQKIHAEGEAVVLGIDVKDPDRSAPRDFVTDRGLTYPSIWDDSGRSLLALDGYPRNAVPSSIVLDRKHRVAAVFLKQVNAAELRTVLGKLAA